ncbi:DUF4175 domain-containing protein [Hymenobacter busanensis]|uniref:DUF4175 domain-containing protein n=1 Tax=Hymenobacter busanensis TaxID=2607656 RepID=A0A7L4ZYI0_9BACT|nr:DUF4175 domain-containing protein [Hymenobacter busanensis]KAA9333423.1 DUF4175 domain-containing protein [Hymenobacter busanensis]QHJ07896.1 hypothetical protein GUY19_11635 [Hymenobacter busanensis]
MNKLPIPPFGIPIALCFVIGWVLVLLFPTRSLLGLSHHAWTGVLFFGTLAAAVYWLWWGVRRESLNDKARKR